MALRHFKVCGNALCAKHVEKFEFVFDLNFCPECGQKLDQGLMSVCHDCHKDARASWKFCAHCGRKLTL
jgi:predicted amidophosphoribosyltransferase